MEALLASLRELIQDEVHLALVPSDQCRVSEQRSVDASVAQLATQLEFYVQERITQAIESRVPEMISNHEFAASEYERLGY